MEESYRQSRGGELADTYPSRLVAELLCWREIDGIPVLVLVWAWVDRPIRDCQPRCLGPRSVVLSGLVTLGQLTVLGAAKLSRAILTFIITLLCLQVLQWPSAKCKITSHPSTSSDLLCQSGRVSIWG